MFNHPDLIFTGCVDCGLLLTQEKASIEESHAIFSFGNAAVKMWRQKDDRHHLIQVHGKPTRLFLSCQPFSKLLTEHGVAAILNFTEAIKPEQEVKNVGNP